MRKSTCPQHIKNHDGTVRAVRCRRWDCPTCGALHASHLIAAARCMPADLLVAAVIRAEDLNKVWHRIRARIPGLSYIAVRARHPDEHLHIALTGCTPAEFMRHASAAGASHVFAAKCLDADDHIGYITRYRMESSDRRISHSRDISYALRRTGELLSHHDYLDEGQAVYEMNDIARRKAESSRPAPAVASPIVPEHHDTVEDHRSAAGAAAAPIERIPGSRSDVVGLLLALLADHTGRITVNIQLEVPEHVTVTPSTATVCAVVRAHESGDSAAAEHHQERQAETASQETLEAPSPSVPEEENGGGERR